MAARARRARRCDRPARPDLPRSRVRRAVRGRGAAGGGLRATPPEARGRRAAGVRRAGLRVHARAARHGARAVRLVGRSVAAAPRGAARAPAVRLSPLGLRAARCSGARSCASTCGRPTSSTRATCSPSSGSSGVPGGGRPSPMTSSRRPEARSRQHRVADLLLRMRDDLVPGPAEEAERGPAGMRCAMRSRRRWPAGAGAAAAVGRRAPTAADGRCPRCGYGRAVRSRSAPACSWPALDFSDDKMTRRPHVRLGARHDRTAVPNEHASIAGADLVGADWPGPNAGGARCPRACGRPSRRRPPPPRATSKMSFQRMTTIGSIPPSKSEATASRLTRSPSFSSRWISTRRGAMSAPVRRRAQRPRDLLAGADEHVGELERLLHRRLDAVEDSGRPPPRRGRRCRRARSPAGGRRRGSTTGRRRASPAVEPVDDVVGDPVALLLAAQQVARELGTLAGGRQGSRAAARAARWTLRPDSSSRSSSWSVGGDGGSRAIARHRTHPARPDRAGFHRFHTRFTPP